jgi:hypothetical protein
MVACIHPSCMNASHWTLPAVGVNDDHKKNYWAQFFGCSWQQSDVASGFQSSKAIASEQACSEGAIEQIVVTLVCEVHGT